MKTMTDEARATMQADAMHISARIVRGKMPFLRGLQACRTKAGMTQKVAAVKIGVCKPTYSGWEQGRTWPTAYHLPLIAAVLGVSIEELYLGPDREQEGGQP